MGFLKNMTKAVVNLAVTPIEIAKDVITMGGTLTDEKESYTAQRLRKANKSFNKALDFDDWD